MLGNVNVGILFKYILTEIAFFINAGGLKACLFCGTDRNVRVLKHPSVAKIRSENVKCVQKNVRLVLAASDVRAGDDLDKIFFQLASFHSSFYNIRNRRRCNTHLNSVFIQIIEQLSRACLHFKLIFVKIHNYLISNTVKLFSALSELIFFVSHFHRV